MTDEILNSMRALREDIRQRLLQSPEYRALVTLDSAIDEISFILRDSDAASAPPPAAAPEANVASPAPPPALPPPPPAVAAPPSPSARHSAIAQAFAETLAAKLEQRNGARAATNHPLNHRAHAG